ncbi:MULTISPECIES: DUF3862 domain-containing protein [Bacillus cereus group]|uniref:DUF3862 domain-containing protein n=1 Tax=Bacillus cereus VD118 TaxID=1053231 RepID=R8Q985_BACCE|nr:MULTISPECIES: DUF3862 domain-containing protein [Bacillus cereus group]EOP67399.1 hypothetical protein IIQ_05352 [Bacillus cereus VD118]MBJ8095378.1 DUF3862 domain-containing protein [Bacillus cereus]MCQ6359513.1 DUF3862 domain-containing protein [Bacillus cereus]MED1406692.1 DUF3862 domain-containing protein [Bacillus mycoides]CAH2464436.1 hypothetical protein ACOSJ1_EBGNOMHC_04970 [Bacillus mycoides KBAB4]
MGEIFKFACLGIIALIVLGVIAAITGGGDDKVEAPSTEPKQEVLTTTPVTKEEPKKEEPKKEEPNKEEAPKNKPGISKAEFDQIQNGMSYEEVKNIIGSDGEVMSESGQAGDQFHTIMYSWKNEKGLGANARFMFQEGKLQNKSQFGLK